MRESRSIMLRLLPLGIPFLGIFCGGLALALAQSFGFFSPLPPLVASASRLAGYQALWEGLFPASFVFTLSVALASSALATALGAVLAYLIWRLPEGLRPAATVYKIPLILPHIAVAFIILILFSQSGLFASIGHALGLIERPADFPALLFAGNGLGLIAAYAFKGLGFVMLLAYSMLARLDRRLITAARMLGASGPIIFRRIALPHMAPVLDSSFIILFLYAFGGFDIPYLLSESNPGMLSILTYNLYFKRDLWRRPEAMAALVLMFLFSAFFVYLYVRIARRLKGPERKL